MRNAEEHKKLLAQIAELEKNSVNYFDVEKEFFLIDSNNLAEVKTRLYGYSIQATGIYEQDNLTETAAANLDGRGCYVYVEAKDGQITIKQDLNGCWGLYLFRHEDYFALSNSFFRLLDHVKFRYPLTVNRDYCNYLLFNELCSHAYSETAVNEIQLLDRSATMRIDIAEKNLQIELIDYHENTIPLNSEEGIAILDNWFDFWRNILRGVTDNTNFITADLSGGFDSRISFLLLLNSGANLNKVRINSIKGTAHTFVEDYAIASQITEHYGIKLNQPLPERQALNFSLADISNLNLYSCQTFSNIPKFWPQVGVDKSYILNGFGGETIRTYWHKLPEKFIERQTLMTNKYSKELSGELSDSIKNILESAFRAVRYKYKIENPNSEDIPQYTYQETRCRSHFGKGLYSNFLMNSVIFSPLLDPELRTLQIKTRECSDSQLLIALIFTRYEPDLLTFPFQGKRSISPETIAFAQKINARFPICHKKGNNLNGGGEDISLTAA